MLDRTSQAALLEALEELGRGSSRRFEDKLWLGFGDNWTRVRLLLLRERGVRHDDGGRGEEDEADGHWIETHGRRGMLQPRWQAASEPVMTSCQRILRTGGPR